MKTHNTLIGVQQEYIDTVNAGYARWEHRALHGFGHYHRIWRGARRVFRNRLAKLGFTEAHIAQALKDAQDVADLERNAEVSE